MNNIANQDDIKKKVLVGLSGGVSSFVAAYILKIQKFDVLAATVIQRVNGQTKCSVSDQDLLGIQDFCRRLNIIHYIIEGDDSFTENVQNAWVSKRIEVKPWSSLCLPCHENRMELLFEKMKELNASQLSTGHFAKVFHSNEGITIHSVHDQRIDQSQIIQHIDPEILSHLILPLATLGTPEIEKLSESFSIKKEKQIISECFTDSLSQDLLESLKGFDVKGEIVSLDGTRISDHLGAFFIPYKSEVGHGPDKGFVIGKSQSSVKIYSANDSYFLRKKIKLIDVLWSVKNTLKRPFTGHLNFSDGSTYKVSIFPKTLSSVVIEFPEEIKLVEFTSLTIYKKKGGGSKLMLSGTVLFENTDEPISEVKEFVF